MTYNAEGGVIEIIIAAAVSTSVPEKWPLWPQFWSKYEAHAAAYQVERKRDAAKRLEGKRRGDGGRRSQVTDRVTK